MATKLVIIQELFSSYRGPIFDRLSLKYNLAVLHGKRKSDLNLIERDYSVTVPPYYFLRGRFVFLNVFSALRKLKPEAIVHQGSPGIVSLPMTWLWCKLTNTGFILWTHGYERHQGFNPNSSFRSWLRLLYFKMADGVLFYTRQRKEFFNGMLPANKLFHATNTLDTEKLLKLRDKFKIQGSESIKRELHIEGYFNIAFIGRLLKEKLPDHLLHVGKKLKQLGLKIKIHLIGDGEEMTALRELCRTLDLDDDVIFYGAVYDDTFSGKILFASDVMVMPGYVGLAINHAYCFDLPVVTYSQSEQGPFHSPEIDYLEPGRTGLMTKSYDPDEMANSVYSLAMDEKLLASYKANVNNKVEELRIEKMEEGFTECIAYTLNKKK
jgi:glycosyltransferase involved in cell wall biosynthesis